LDENSFARMLLYEGKMVRLAGSGATWVVLVRPLAGGAAWEYADGSGDLVSAETHEFEDAARDHTSADARAALHEVYQQIRNPLSDVHEALRPLCHVHSAMEQIARELNDMNGVLDRLHEEMVLKRERGDEIRRARTKRGWLE
jgi:hypothetical protein